MVPFTIEENYFVKGGGKGVAPPAQYGNEVSKNHGFPLFPLKIETTYNKLTISNYLYK